MSRDRNNVTALLDDVPSYSRQNAGGIFVVIKGPDRGESVRLTREPVSFGSGPQCSLVLTAPPVLDIPVLVLDGDQQVATGSVRRPRR